MKYHLCEWNPELDREARSGDIHPYLHDAIRAIKVGDEWYRLCENCLKLPRFKHPVEQATLDAVRY